MWVPLIKQQPEAVLSLSLWVVRSTAFSISATTLYLAPALLCSPLLLNNRWGTSMMRSLCRHFKWDVCFFFALERESVSPALDLPACVYVRFLPIHLHPMPVLYPPPPLWTSFSPPQLPSFSSQLAPFSLVTARALNFHDCCLILARSSSLLLPLPSSFLPSSFPIPSLVTWCLSPSLPLSHFSFLP